MPDATHAQAADVQERDVSQPEYVLVPKKPTEAMINAALVEMSDVTIESPKASAWDALRAYRAMIAAAPPLTAQPAPEVAGLVEELRTKHAMPPYYLAPIIQIKAADALTTQAAKIETAEARAHQTGSALILSERRVDELTGELTAAAAKIADLERDAHTFMRQIDEVYAAVSDHWFLDPPDGGDVRLHEGVKRIEDAYLVEKSRAAALEKALREVHKLLHESASGMTFRDAEAGKRYTAAIALMVAALTTEPRP
jgi:hypothetical protein